MINFGRGVVNILQCVDMKVLSGEESFEQKHKRSEGGNHTEIREKSMENGGESKCKGPETVVCLVCPNHSKKAKVIETKYKMKD